MVGNVVFLALFQPNLYTFKLLNMLALRSDSFINEQTIPLYHFNAATGLMTLPMGSGIPCCDGATHVTGDSMEPILCAGDIVLYKVVPNSRRGLFYGNIYLLSFDLDDEAHTAIKYVHEAAHPEHYRLVSANPRHAPWEIPISNIREMAIVKACVRNLNL